MKCIRVTAPKEPLLYLEDEPIPKAPDGGAVVKISHCGVCHSDVHFWEGGYSLGDGTELKFRDRPGFVYPCIPGHEVSGNLFSLGGKTCENSGDSLLRLGDRVVVYPFIDCNVCRPCKTGHNDFCDGSPPVNIGMTQDGGFAQYVCVPDLRYLVPISDSVPFPIASILPCCGLTAYHAVEVAAEYVKTFTEFKGGCSVLAIGAGGVGQWGVVLARALFPPETQILCAEVKQEALDSVTGTVRDLVPLLMTRGESCESVVERVRAASRNSTGVDLVMDFVGATQTFQIAHKLRRKQGCYLVTGLLGGQVQIPVANMVLNGLTVKGIKVGSLHQLRRLVQLVAEMPSLYANLRCDVYPLEDGVSILENLAKGEVVGRAVLRCNGGDE